MALSELLGTRHPIIQAPMAGADSLELALAVEAGGGLGSLGCAMLSLEEIARLPRTINLNFFCHRPPRLDAAKEAAWRARLAPYYVELGISQPAKLPARAAFDEAACEIVETLKPRVVSFHFGLPDAPLLQRVKDTGAKVLSTATSVAEARWLAEREVDAIIAQGVEAGGHRGSFLDLTPEIQIGTLALVPRIVDAVRVPVIAAGGIADGRGIAAAMKLGAQGVQIGTAYLFCPEAKISPLYRKALSEPHETALTNVFSGRPARGIVNRFVRDVGPISRDAPDFPQAAEAVAPLRAASAARGSADFMQMWAGAAAALCKPLPAKELTERFAAAL